MNDKQDLTTGTISKKLIAYALPLLAANLLQSFYSLMDMLVVGRIVGETGLAAISNASMLSFIINSVCIGITMGGTVLAAQYKGAKDEHGQIEMRQSLSPQPVWPPTGRFSGCCMYLRLQWRTPADI